MINKLKRKFNKNTGSINFIDVGCGNNLIEPWLKNKKEIKFILAFDPLLNRSYSLVLKRNQVDYEIYKCAVSDKVEKKIMYVCNKKECSSLFCPNEKIINKFNKWHHSENKKSIRFNVRIKKKIKCVRLDFIIKK